MIKTSKNENIIPSSPVDFVIITALEEERDAMLSKLTGFRKVDKESDDIHTSYYAEVKSQRKDGSVYQVIVTNLLNTGPLNATALSVATVNKWKPQFVILVGIACGVKGEVNYGDVMIATQVADYTLAKRIEGNRHVRWEVFPSGSSLLDSANNISHKWINKIVQPRPELGNVEKVKGVIASGGDVISDDEVIKAYSESWPKMIGIEMESGGVAAGVHQTPDSPEFIMIKSVSDFGKDKHDPEVKPWRKYACHTAAAFTLGLIKSGPAQSYLLSNKKAKYIKDEDEKKEAAERRWKYIQSHIITSIDILIFLTSSVGYDWFVGLFDDICISFTRENRLKLSHVLKHSPKPNTQEIDHKLSRPISSFWEMYEPEDGIWCKRIKSDGRSLNLVAGFDTSIPWNLFDIPEIVTLQDLAACDDIGVSFPPQLFQAGIEEAIFRVNGETFSFSVYMSEDKPLQFYHEMANTFYRLDSKIDDPIHFSMSFQGVQLLDMFHKQIMPGYKRVSKKQGLMLGQSGPTGNAISFYPSMPISFSKTKESDEYSFKINVPGQIDYKKIEEDLLQKIKKNKNEVDNYINLASLYSMQHRFPDVIRLLTKEINQVKPNSDVHGILGSSYANLGRYNEALAEFKKAESLAPDNSKVQKFIGNILQELGENEAALVHIENAANLEPLNDSYQYDLCRILAVLNRTDEALSAAKKAVYLAPNNAENNITLGMMLHVNGQDDEAITYMETAINLDSKSPRAYRYYAQILASKGDIEKAIKNYEQSIKLRKDVACYADYGRFLCNIERWSEAESVIQDGLSIDQKNYDLLVYLDFGLFTSPPRVDPTRHPSHGKIIPTGRRRFWS